MISCILLSTARCSFRQMQLSPDMAAFFAVFFDFPLAFTEDLQPGGINHRVRDFTPGGRFKTEIDRLCPPADTAVIRTEQRNAHQGKNGINEALCSRQGQSEYAFNHQNGSDGKVRIARGLPRAEGGAVSYHALIASSSSQKVMEPRLISALL